MFAWFLQRHKKCCKTTGSFLMLSQGVEIEYGLGKFNIKLLEALQKGCKIFVGESFCNRRTGKKVCKKRTEKKVMMEIVNIGEKLC